MADSDTVETRKVDASKSNNPDINTNKRILRVDQVYSRKDRKHHFIKTKKEINHTERFQKYDLVVRRIISLKGVVQNEEIDIKSEKLVQVLKEALAEFSDLSLLDRSPPEISPELLFHAKESLATRLKAEGDRASPDTVLMSAIESALEYIMEKFGHTITNLQSLLAKELITYELLWTLFPGGITVISSDNEWKELQAAKMGHGTYEEKAEARFFLLHLNLIEHIETKFAWVQDQFMIPYFEGSKKITNLIVYPFKNHPNSKQCRSEMILRGKRYVEISNQPMYQEYMGIAIYEEENMEKRSETPFTATGRIMLDPTAFAVQNPDARLLLRNIRAHSEANVITSALTDDELMVCNHRVLGFSFHKKIWGAFAVSKTKAVTWNERAIDKLIMEEKKKKTVSLLIKSHRHDNDSFDDIVRGKGNGLVGLLSGSPGVGKTLTAEVMAELSRRPLYVISAAELGATAESADKKLHVILDITKRWNCILLIDEADVFLYRRVEGQLEMNALVSVFLRRLEYFQGIAILTTNRRDEIDDAFKSRIHFSFHYPSLEEDDRLKLWKNFLNEACRLAKCPELQTKELRSLAKRSMNGREIKNTVSCAASIARAGKEPITATLVMDMLEIISGDQTNIN